MRQPSLRLSLVALLVILVIAPVSADTQPPLQVKVFNALDDHMGLGVNSAIIYGENDAVLVDAQFTLSNAHRLVADILETGRNLTTIYIAHEHPDHFMGLPVVMQAFPDAKVVSLKVTADDINASFDFHNQYRGNQVLGSNGAKSTIFVETLEQPLLMLEGRRLEILGPFQGDAPNSSVVWVPSIKTLIASDLIYAHAHAWLSAGKSPELRQAWLHALDQLEALNPVVVVPGYAPSDKYLSPASIDFTRQYIKTFIKQMNETANSAELMAEMRRIYPDAVMQFALEYSAKILKDGWVWEGQWPPSLRDMKPR